MATAMAVRNDTGEVTFERECSSIDEARQMARRWAQESETTSAEDGAFFRAQAEDGASWEYWRTEAGVVEQDEAGVVTE